MGMFGVTNTCGENLAFSSVLEEKASEDFMHLSGKTINLVSEDYTATIVTMGGAVAGLKYHDRDVIMPFNPQSIPISHQGKILAPWPNRISDGKYFFDEREFQLPITELSTMSASHGLVAWIDWKIQDLTSSSAVLTTHVNPVYGYPFLIKLTAHYELINGMGLKVSITALNEGKVDAPYGVGMHPYITCNQALIDDCKLTMPFTECFTLTERKVPEQKVNVGTMNFDFTQGRKLGTTEIDHCFINPDSRRMTTVSLENEEMQVYCKTNAPFVQLFTPAKLGRKCLAVEPMSCPANAFNNQIGLIVLKEQQYHTLDYVIGALDKKLHKEGA